MSLYNNCDYYGHKGSQVSCSSVNTGLFAALLETPTVSWVSVGHNHKNDFYGLYQGINLGYGRKSGYGGSSDPQLKAGARVFEVTEGVKEIRTWVRQEDGSVIIETEAKRRGKGDKIQTKCARMKL